MVAVLLGTVLAVAVLGVAAVVAVLGLVVAMTRTHNAVKKQDSTHTHHSTHTQQAHTH